MIIKGFYGYGFKGESWSQNVDKLPESNSHQYTYSLSEHFNKTGHWNVFKFNLYNSDFRVVSSWIDVWAMRRTLIVMCDCMNYLHAIVSNKFIGRRFNLPDIRWCNIILKLLVFSLLDHAYSFAMLGLNPY